MSHKISNLAYITSKPFAMKSLAIIVALAALAFTSCTSAYKTGQTPDDVYFSPARPGGTEEYVQSEKRDDRRYQGSDDYYEDRYLRMRANDRSRWSVLDDYYMNSPYAYNYYGNYYGNSLFSPYNNYWQWNTYYNPYCSYSSYYPYYNNVIIIKNPGKSFTPPSRPIAFNPSSYSSNPGTSSRAVSNRYISTYTPATTGGSRYNNSNRGNGSGFSNGLQKIFSNSNSSNSSYNPSSSNSSSSTPSRSYNPSSSSSSSSSGSSRSSSSGSSGSSSSGASRPNR
jgi:hypothetical protein